MGRTVRVYGTGQAEAYLCIAADTGNYRDPVIHEFPQYGGRGHCAGHLASWPDWWLLVAVLARLSIVRRRWRRLYCACRCHRGNWCDHGGLPQRVV